MPVNRYGEIVRNTPRRTTSSGRGNGGNRNNNGGGGSGIAIVIGSMILIAVIWFLRDAVKSKIDEYGQNITAYESQEEDTAAEYAPEEDGYYDSDSTENENDNEYSENSWDDASDLFDYGIYKDGRGISSSDYVIRDSDSRYLTERDTDQLTLRGINYAKNELYARYGRKFVSTELQDFFGSRDWYYGYLEASKESDRTIHSDFNDYEKYNADFLYDLEASMGMYDLD